MSDMPTDTKEITSATGNAKLISFHIQTGL